MTQESATVDELIFVTAVYTRSLDRCLFTPQKVEECVTKVLARAGALAVDVRPDVVTSRVCAALSYMGLLESTCTAK